MVNLFGSRKRLTAQGFRKYNNEIHQYEQDQLNSSGGNVAGLPNTGVNRTASMTSSAGSAALAALRLHQNSKPLEEPRPSYGVHNTARANSLNSGAQRSNSLKSYTYHPKGSYIPGQASISSANNTRRYSSLTLGSSTNVPQFLPPAPPRKQRLLSLNSHSSHASAPKTTLFEENSEEEGETVITTQTTKVLDAQGRVLSITTKTIKTLPDGSNIIETTTKNISRSNSRANSLRNSSIISNSRDASYNLQKIDEDLQDFEYDYQVDHPEVHTQPGLSPRIDVRQHSELPHEHRDARELESDLLHNSESLRLNVEQPNVRSNSFKKSSETSPAKPLKSILKNTQKPEFADGSESESLQQPYKADNNSGSPKSVHSQPKKSPMLKASPVLKQSPILRHNSKLSPTSRDEIVSNASATSPSNTSIKFDDNVETIPIYETDYNAPKKTSNSDIYSKAMEVAMEKVYGNSKDVDSNVESSIEEKLRPSIEEKNKRDKKLEILGHSGVNDNYHYENHHKDFAVHSMRDASSLKSPEKRNRSKEEKRLKKERERQLKLEEKQKRDLAKAEAKAKKNAEKQLNKGSPKRGIFGRKRGNTSDSSVIGSDISSFGSSPATQKSYITSPINSPTRNGNFNSIPEDDVLHPTEDPTISPVLPKPKSEGTQPSIDDIQTPLVEPTIRMDSNESSSEKSPVFKEQSVFKGGLAAPVSLVSETDGNDKKELEEPKEAKVDSLANPIPTPILNDLNDTDTPEDSGVFSSDYDEDELARSSSKRLANEKFFETKDFNDEKADSGLKETSSAITETVDSEADKTPKLGAEPVMSKESKDKIDNVKVETSPRSVRSTSSSRQRDLNFPITIPGKLEKGMLAVDEIDTSFSKSKPSIDVTKLYSLAELIKMGREEDTTEDSFVPPDVDYDSDSDASSKFSADLNAALRRITDDKEDAASGMPGDSDDSDNSVIRHQIDRGSNSTPPTKESESGINGPLQIDPTLVTKTKKDPSTPSKKSKFRAKIYKYFVNSYDK